jgi:sporulation protein YlmC with PRC-barrel domain
MKHRLLALGLAGALTLGTGAAFAADDSHGVSTIKPDELRASKVIGSSVYDHNNQKIGSVQDIILGQGGRVDSVIVDVGSYLGMGGKNVAVKLADIKTDHDRLTLSETKDQLQQAPAYQLTDRNTGAGQTASAPSGGNAANPR